MPPSFDFGMYLSECMDISIVELVEVDISSWMAMIVVVGLNLVRVQLESSASAYAEEEAVLEEEYGEGEEGGEGHGRNLLKAAIRRVLGAAPAVDCSVNATDAVEYGAEDDGHRLLGGAADPCAPKETGTVITFMIAGWSILAMSVIVMYQSRQAFMNLMKKAGCSNVSLYHSKLVQINAKGSTKFALAKQAMSRRKGALDTDGEKKQGKVRGCARAKRAERSEAT